MEASNRGGNVFVGRSAELAELSRGLDSTVNGRGAVYLLAGEPGIGKTRLADELARQAEATGVTVVWGRCWEGGGAPAYWPWLQILRPAAQSGGADALTELQRSDIAQIAPDLFEAIDDQKAPPTGDPDAARFRLFTALATCLKASTRNTPSMFVVDDIHAADTASLLFLRFLAADIRGTPLLVVATYRDTAVGRGHPLAETLPELIREPVVRRIELRGLDQDAVAEYVQAAAGTASHAVVAAVHQETEGNPLFVEELVRLLLAENRLEEVNDPGRRISVPQGVRDVILRRVSMLSDRCANVLSAASVFGREFGLDVLAYITELPESELLEVADEAVAAKLMTESGAGFKHFRFSHQLVRDALPTPSRIRMHRRAGVALETMHTHDHYTHFEHLAHHFFEAAQPDDLRKATEYAQKAAERAAHQLAYEESARLYQRAIQGLDLSETTDDKARCDLLLGLGEMLVRAGDDPAAKEAFLGAAEAARKADLPERFARAALGYGGRFTWSRAGTARHLVPLLEEALANDLPDHVRVRVLARLACALRGTPDLERCDALSREAVDLARRTGDSATLAYALDGRFGAIWWPWNPEERLAIAEELLRIAREIGSPESESVARFARINVFLELVRSAEAHAEQQAIDRLAEDLRQPSLRWLAWAAKGLIALQEGNFDLAHEAIAQSERHGVKSQPIDSGSSISAQAFWLAYEEDRIDGLDDALTRAAERYRWYAVFDAWRAQLLAELGREDEARVILDDMARDDFSAVPVDNEWLLVLCILVQASALLGDVERADVLLRILEPHAGRNAIGPAEGCLGAVDRFLGLAAATAGRTDQAIEHFERALALNEKMSATACVTRTKVDYARALRLRDAPGDAARANALLASALETARAIGQRRLARQITDAPAATAATEAVFVREGDFFSIAFAGETARLKDAKGLRYVGRLLQHPGREVHALDLVAAEEETGGVLEAEDAPGEILDDAAKSAFRRRVTDLEEEIAEATDWGDSERAARAREELDAITAQLASAVGLGGRDRKTGSAAERARVSVTRAIRSALPRVREASPALGAHLEATLRTGVFCSYVPDPRAPISWRT